MPKNKGEFRPTFNREIAQHEIFSIFQNKQLFNLGKGGKNRRRGKNENEDMKRELVFKDDGQGIN